MAVEGAQPPRRTLGHYAIHQGPKFFYNIAIPTTNRALEKKPPFLTPISTNQFIVIDHEEPRTHLATFYKLVGTMGFQSGHLESVYC